MEATPAATTTSLDRLLLQHRVEEFFALEADLLDDRDFTGWLALLDERIAYRVLMTRNVHSSDRDRGVMDRPLDVCWMDEGIETLRQRVAQFETGIHWAEEPVSRTTHLVSNVRIVSSTPSAQATEHRVRTRFLLYRNRGRGRNEEWLVGKRSDVLVDEDGAIRLLVRDVTIDQTVLLANNLATFL